MNFIEINEDELDIILDNKTLVNKQEKIQNKVNNNLLRI